jgi:hypothetical protein
MPEMIPQSPYFHNDIAGAKTGKARAILREFVKLMNAIVTRLSQARRANRKHAG